ncbi:MAG: efflux RND transporter permease subunit [Acidimicrobiia bacterium]
MSEFMHRFWSSLAVNLGKHAGLVSVIGLLITLTLGVGITQLEFTSSQAAYLNTTDPVYRDNVAYQKLFGGEAMLTVITMDKGHSVVELLNDANRPKLVAAGKKLASDKKDILGVITPVDALNLTKRLVASPTCDPTQSIAGKLLLDAQARAPAADQGKRLADASETLARVTKVPCAQQTIANPAWVQFLLIDNQNRIRKALLPFFPDPRHALIITRLKGNASIEGEGRGADFTIATTKSLDIPNAKLVTGGAAVLLKDINDYLKGGTLTLGGIAVAIMIVILLVLFKVRWRLLPLGIVLIGVIWAFGLAGYLGIPLTLVTISGLPVMLGIGIDYAIQMHARVEEEVVIDHSEHPIQETARNLGPALLVVTFDAIFAFAALHFSKVPMIRDFGLLLAVGVAAICFCSIAGTLAALGIREYRSPTQAHDFREGPLGRLVVFLGGMSSRVAPVLVVAALVIFVGGILVEDKLVIQTDPIEWVNPDSTAVRNIHEIEHRAGISSELGMYVVSNNAFSNTSVRFLDSFTAEQQCRYGDAGRLPESCTPADAAVPAKKRVLANASSIVSIVSFLTEVPGTKPIVPTGAQVKQVWDVAPAGIQKSTVSADGKAANLIFATTPASLAKRAVVVKEIRARVHPPVGIRATPSGLAVVGVGLLDNLEANRILLTYLALVFVFLFLSIRLRSIIRSLLSLVPVMIAVGVASLFAYFAGFTLSPMTAVGGPLVIAACTEFTSLILLRFVEERRRGLDPKHAVDVAAARTGRAFIVSALTAISGVAVLSLSSLPLLRDFGRIVAVNVAVALLSALVVLPPMLVWADKRNWVSRGLVKPRPVEQADEYAPSPDGDFLPRD